MLCHYILFLLFHFRRRSGSLIRHIFRLILISSAVFPAILPCSLPAFADAPPPQGEPEGEAVKACPRYGEGYFFLPGTNTCLRLSGYVRTEAEGGDYLYARRRNQLHRKTYAARSRAALRFSAVTDTDLGELRGFAEMQSQWDAGARQGNPVTNASEQLRFAYIELGGLRIGAENSLFNRWTDYYGNVIADDLLTPLEEARTNAVSYSFAPVSLGNSSRISAILGMEQGYADGDRRGFRYGAGGERRFRKLSQQTESYMPNLISGLRVESGRAALAAAAAFDAYYSAWAGKIRLDITASDRLSLWAMAGYKSMSDYYADDSAASLPSGAPPRIHRQISSLYGDWGGHWIVWAGGSYALNPKTDFNNQLSYDSAGEFAAAANIRRSIVPGLSLTPEVSYAARNDKYGYKYSSGAEEKTALRGHEAMQGMLRLQRSF